ncbi:MAG TPA: hypothetical protein VGQ37_17825 [Vicinamibacterales bacterium]|nr:hypothetical protein [Vicinamibacterales bacterium]
MSVFTFISVAAWAGARAAERKDFYRSETLKKLAEAGSAAVVDYLREEEKAEERQRAHARARMIEGNRLGGLILLVVGATVTVAFYQIVPDVPVYLFGVIPFGIGLVLLGSSMFGRRG